MDKLFIWIAENFPKNIRVDARHMAESRVFQIMVYIVLTGIVLMFACAPLSLIYQNRKLQEQLFEKQKEIVIAAEMLNHIDGIYKKTRKKEDSLSLKVRWLKDEEQCRRDEIRELEYYLSKNPNTYKK